MHEKSLLADVLRKIESVARENNAKRVLKVKVKLGALAHISPGHFRVHFEAATPGTVAEGAELEVQVVPDIRDPHAQAIVLDCIELSDR